jgi:hypothetical protein
MTADRDMEQIDFGIGYRGRNSPQQHMTLTLAGGTLAIALSLIALGGVLIASLLLPQLLQSYTNEAVAVQTRSIAAQAATAQDRAWGAQQQATITAEQLKIMEIDLAKKGLLVRRVDGH